MYHFILPLLNLYRSLSIMETSKLLIYSRITYPKPQSYLCTRSRVCIDCHHHLWDFDSHVHEQEGNNWSLIIYPERNSSITCGILSISLESWSLWAYSSALSFSKPSKLELYFKFLNPSDISFQNKMILFLLFYSQQDISHKSLE